MSMDMGSSLGTIFGAINTAEGTSMPTVKGPFRSQIFKYSPTIIPRTWRKKASAQYLKRKPQTPELQLTRDLRVRLSGCPVCKRWCTSASEEFRVLGFRALGFRVYVCTACGFGSSGSGSGVLSNCWASSPAYSWGNLHKPTG